MRRMVVVLVAALIVALVGSAWASPNLLGPSGLILTPTAETLGMTQFDLGASWFDLDELDTSAIYGNVGVLPGLEVGASIVSPEDVDSELLLNAKYRLPQPVPVKLSLAVGVMDITDEIDSTPYLVLSHTLGAGLIPAVGPWNCPQIHAGVASGMIDGLFGGFSVNYNAAKLMAEYDGENVNLGVKYPIVPKVELQAAGVDGLDHFAVGASFTSPW